MTSKTLESSIKELKIEANEFTKKYVDTIDAFEKTFGKVSSTIDKIGSNKLLKKITSILGVNPVDIISGINEIFHIWETENQTSIDIEDLWNLLNKLIDEIENLERVVGDSSELNSQNWVDLFRILKIDIINAKAYFNNPNKNDPHNSIIAAFTASLNRSQSNTDQLSNSETSYWKRVFTDRIAYFDIWSDRLEPPNDGRFVWDYRYILPVCLETILSRIIILQVADSDYQELIGREECAMYLKRLTKIHDRITLGITKIPPPKAHDLFEACLLTVGDLYLDINTPIFYPRKLFDEKYVPFITYGARWVSSRCIFGAVETYSAENCTGELLNAWPPSDKFELGLPILPLDLPIDYDPPKPQPSDPYDPPPEPRGPMMRNHYRISDYKSLINQYRSDHKRISDACIDAYKKYYDENQIYKNFLMVHALITRKKCEELYDKLGLPNLRNIIGYLSMLVGEPIPSMNNDYTKYSIRMISALIHDAINEPIPTPLSLRSLSIKLINTSDEAYLLSPGQIVMPKKISIRKLFELKYFAW